MWSIPRFWLTIPLLLLLTAARPLPATGGYKLGVQDKIRVRVYEWHHAVDQVHRWTPLNDDFTVAADGTVALPLLGNVRAAGRTTDELATVISSRLQETVGLASPPNTAIEIVRYRPFYILGNVNKPGEYQYRPGMTVLQALSVAGGLYRPAGIGLLQFEQSALETAGSLHLLRSEAERLMARRARLQAELAGKSTLTFPPELTQRRNDPVVARLLQQEARIFAARHESLQKQDDLLTQRRRLLTDDLQSLYRKMHNEDYELAMLGRQVKRVTMLVKRGLAVAPREFALQQNQVELKGRRLDLDTEIMRVKEQISKADEDILRQQAERHKQALLEEQQTEAKLSQVNEEIRTKDVLVEQNQMMGPALARNGDKLADPSFSIVRRVNGTVREIKVAASAEVAPGDTIKVGQPPGAAGPAMADQMSESGDRAGAAAATPVLAQ